jgi:SPP1 family predicted phage head-tail adaptor
MDRRISIEVLTSTRGSSGGQNNTWAELAEVWANIDYRGGNEMYEADEKTAINKVKFTIRYLSTVTETNRVNYESGIYDILHIEVVGRNCYQVITAEKKTINQQA